MHLRRRAPLREAFLVVKLSSLKMVGFGKLVIASLIQFGGRSFALTLAIYWQYGFPSFQSWLSRSYPCKLIVSHSSLLSSSFPRRLVWIRHLSVGAGAPKATTFTYEMSSLGLVALGMDSPEDSPLLVLVWATTSITTGGDRPLGQVLGQQTPNVIQPIHFPLAGHWQHPILHRDGCWETSSIPPASILVEGVVPPLRGTMSTLHYTNGWGPSFLMTFWSAIGTSNPSSHQ